MTKMRQPEILNVRTMDMKVNLLLIDEEERKNGKEFMKKMKYRWDAMYPTLKSASKQKLRDNASREKGKRLPT